jgi:flagellar protein FlbT
LVEKMPGLVLELKQDDLIVINGAVIRFRTKSRIEINGRARFLFGKQVLLPDQSTTPARRIYLALQTAYVGNDNERGAGLEEARNLISAFRARTASPLAREMLDKMLSLAVAGECYEALKLARTVIRHEDSVAKQFEIDTETDLPIEETESLQTARQA